MKPPNPIDVVEAAYRMGVAGDVWLRGVLEAAAPLFLPGTHASGYFFDFSGARATPVHGVQVLGAPPEIVERLAAFHDGQRELSRAVILNTPSAVTGSQHARAAGLGQEFEQFIQHFAVSGVRMADTLGVVGVDPLSCGVVIACVYEQTTTLSRPARLRWRRIAAHLVAGARLRDALERQRAPAESPPEAVLSPSGRLEYAAGEAAERTARESLRERAVAIDRARGRLGRSDPDAALETWRGLVSGRWSLVDRFESDGRRYVVAHRNEPKTATVLSLSARERQVVGHVLLGHTSKLTAYTLGISAAAVSAALKSAMQKLAVRNLAQLLDRLGGIAGDQPPRAKE